MSGNVVLATGNPGKVKEMQSVLQTFGLQVRPQSEFNVPEADETGLTFVENAIIKARNACLHTGMPAIADDSGLEVEALAGAPGIYSSRYAEGHAGDADQANNNKLLTALNGESNRSARFQCVIVYLRHDKDPTPLICSGTWQGEIAQHPSGTGGFGYDPIFYLPALGCHSAELPVEQKKQISHRGQALAQLKIRLKQYL